MIDTTYRWPMIFAVVMMTILLALSQNAKSARDPASERDNVPAVHTEVISPDDFSTKR